MADKRVISSNGCITGPRIDDGAPMGRYTNESSLAFADSSSKTELASSAFDQDNSIGGSRFGISEDRDEYNPFAHRNIARPNTDMGALAHFLKCSLGSGILAMPNAFRSGGLVFGTIATLIVGYVCTHCVYMLVNSSHILCRRLKVPSLNYAETAEAAVKTGPLAIRRYAPTVRRFVDISLAVTYYSVSCVYIVFVAASIKQVADIYSGVSIDVRLCIAGIFLPLLVLGGIRELKVLVPFSAAANVCIVISFSLTLYYVFREWPDFSERRLGTSLGQLPLFFSTVIFAMEGIGAVMPIENSMENPKHFLSCPGILCIAMSIVVFLYNIIGIFGYAKYGDDTLGSITLNLPTEEPTAQAVKLLIAFAILCTYGLQYYIPTEITWRLIRPSVPQNRLLVCEYWVRFVGVTVTVIIAASVPHLGPIISLVGALFFSTLGLIIPAIVDAITSLPLSPDASEVRLTFVSKLRLIRNALYVVFAMGALLSGSYTSIKEIGELSIK